MKYLSLAIVIFIYVRADAAIAHPLKAKLECTDKISSIANRRAFGLPDGPASASPRKLNLQQKHYAKLMRDGVRKCVTDQEARALGRLQHLTDIAISKVTGCKLFVDARTRDLLKVVSLWRPNGGAQEDNPFIDGLRSARADLRLAGGDQKAACVRLLDEFGPSGKTWPGIVVEWGTPT